MTKPQIASAQEAVKRNTAKRAGVRTATIRTRNARRDVDNIAPPAGVPGFNLDELKEDVKRNNIFHYTLADIFVALLGATTFWLLVIIAWFALS
jgi:hypothetical protein